MSMINTISQTTPQHQTNWDWRAASNFMFGGSGAGLLLFAALTSTEGMAYRPFGGVALGLIALGLGCVSLEIGRPLRSLNVFLHIQTSWMTREALAAIFVFLSGLLAVWTGSALWIWLAVLFGMLFLYCQLRILTASKGIPAWREPSLGPLMMMTGLAEGAGLFVIIAALSGVAPAPTWMQAVLLLGVFGRAIMWRDYRRKLSRQVTPPQTFRAFDLIDSSFIRLGHWTAGALVAAALLVASTDASPWLCAIGGVFVVTSGWLFKFTLVARAAYNQGYALPRLPVRGRPPTDGAGTP